jgi:methylenetetrahydrofolate dehydrogenase (NADP+)/methenyltetrahydrofolate cyclohydrolase
MTLLLDGRLASQTLSSKLEVNLKNPPHIVLILVGNHPSSLSYISIKQRMCRETHIRSTLVHLPEDTTEHQLLTKIEGLNHDPDVDGILIQLPLPKQIDLKRVTYAIDPKKDVDCFHPINLGKLCLGSIDGFVPCTPQGILELLKFYNLDIQRKEVCILGRSTIVGRPLSILLSLKNTIDATVTLCHQGTSNFIQHTKKADILISAIGQPQLIKQEHIKDGAIVIDVGITRQGDKLVGDVDFEDVRPKAQAITPVPGGVGPMTVYALLQNTTKAHKQRKANL